MVDLNNVQAIVPRASARPFFAVPMFRMTSVSGAKAFLQDWVLRVPGGTAPEPVGAPALHPVFSWRAIEFLLAGRGEWDLAAGRAAFEPFFADPKQAPDSAAMAGQLGFGGASSPGGWWDGFRSGDIDLALYSTFESESQRSETLADLRRSAAARGLEELPLGEFAEGALAGYRPEGGRLHMGFRDGVTAPDIDWADQPSPGRVDFREFISGYPNRDYPTTPWRPGPWQAFAAEGSFACLTWIYQDVARFNAFLRRHADTVAALAGQADPQEWLASRIMGRWRDGTAVMLHPLQPPATPDLSDGFGYAGDPDGLTCPLTAHVRVVYGRDEPLSFANRLRFPRSAPRLLRRGFSYGSHLDGELDDGQSRGVIGLFFCARVNEQFYTVLRWMQTTDFTEAFERLPQGLRRQDALMGRRSHPDAVSSLRLVAKQHSPVEIALPDFIRYRGVAVMFAPGIRSLNVLAGV